VDELEFEQYLVHVTGPWIVPNYTSVTRSKPRPPKPNPLSSSSTLNTRSTGMDKLFKRKFRVPTKVRFVPKQQRPRSEGDDAGNALTGRKRPLQPGEWERICTGGNAGAGAGGAGHIQGGNANMNRNGYSNGPQHTARPFPRQTETTGRPCAPPIPTRMDGRNYDHNFNRNRTNAIVDYNDTKSNMDTSRGNATRSNDNPHPRQGGDSFVSNDFDPSSFYEEEDDDDDDNDDEYGGAGAGGAGAGAAGAGAGDGGDVNSGGYTHVHTNGTVDNKYHCGKGAEHPPRISLARGGGEKESLPPQQMESSRNSYSNINYPRRPVRMAGGGGGGEVGDQTKNDALSKMELLELFGGGGGGGDDGNSVLVAPPSSTAEFHNAEERGQDFVGSDGSGSDGSSININDGKREQSIHRQVSQQQRSKKVSGYEPCKGGGVGSGGGTTADTSRSGNCLVEEDRSNNDNDGENEPKSNPFLDSLLQSEAAIDKQLSKQNDTTIRDSEEIGAELKSNFNCWDGDGGWGIDGNCFLEDDDDEDDDNDNNDGGNQEKMNQTKGNDVDIDVNYATQEDSGIYGAGNTQGEINEEEVVGKHDEKKHIRTKFSSEEKVIKHMANCKSNLSSSDGDASLTISMKSASSPQNPVSFALNLSLSDSNSSDED